jgi:PAS domain S-box-containing protein
MQGGEAERQEGLFNKLQAEGRLYDMPTRYEAWWRCKDGSLKCLEDHWIPEYDGGRVVRVDGVLRDITERKRMEEALSEERNLLRTLIDSLPDHISVKDAEGRYVLVNASYARFLGLGAPEEVVGKTIFNFYPPELAEKIQADDRSLIQVGQPMINVERPGVDHAGNKMWLLGTKVPLRDRGGKVIGLVGIARDVTDSKQRERELEAIATVSSALRTATTRSDMLPVILDQLLDLLKAQASSLVMGDPGSGESVVELAHGDWASTTGLRMPPGEGLNGYVISTGKPYVNDDVHSDPRLIRPELLPGPQSVVGVPLTVHGQTIGVLWVGRSGKGESLPQPFTEQELRLFTSIVDMAANAIHRATLHEQTEKRLQRLSALRAIDMAITASLDVRVTLNVFLEQTTAQLSVDAADVLLLNPHTQTLSYAAGRGFRTNALQHTRLRLGEGHAGLAALERRIIAIPNLAEEAGDLKRAPLLADEGFIAYYAAPLIAKGHVRGVLEVFHRTPLDPDQEWLDFLEALAGQAAIAIDNAELFNNLQRSNMELILAYDTTLEGWSRALELRDLETQGHTQKVTEMTLRLARLMGFKDDQLVHIRRGALLHDIGKMGIPDSILLKAGPLTEEEREIMCRHTEYAYEMLSPIAYLRPALETPYCHHEKWDGTGYPRGLKGDSIPLPARIFAVVDVWDALRSDRPYRAGWPEEKVREHIQLLSGTHFDPQVVEVFLEMGE